jgi:ABC-type antimicrobial peptide transport system permease subunit
MALGAKPAEVIRLVLSHTAVLVVAGGAIGVALALATRRFFGQILYGVHATDPLTYGVAISNMGTVAFAACWLPARRAIAVDPVMALRTE